CPGGEVIGAPEGLQLELSASVRLNPGDAKRGTLAEWQSAIAAAANAENVPHFVLGAAAGFVGPILQIINHDPCGINLHSATSTGKTTTQKEAISPWSNPDI